MSVGFSFSAFSATQGRSARLANPVGDARFHDALDVFQKTDVLWSTASIIKGTVGPAESFSFECFTAESIVTFGGRAGVFADPDGRTEGTFKYTQPAEVVLWATSIVNAAV